MANLWLESRRAAEPAIPPAAHTDAEVRAWFREVVFAGQEVWVIGPHGRPEAMMVLQGEWVEQLYVAPGRQRRGHGSRLIGLAQSRWDALSLWTFETNHSARAFYERHGFVADEPASADNEEGAPALLYRWRGR
ncbi:MAG TPA: GNAT family N-acetyltransferase [Solirubrobacteraceae bacterium]|nr:GNAT family N-acetyltransferase [Solirubrobacteraceae bacterium]